MIIRSIHSRRGIVGTLQSLALISFTAAMTSTASAENDFRQVNQPVATQFEFLASGLDDQNVEYFSRVIGQDLDQIQFLPHGSEKPSHLVACIEEALECLAPESCAEPFQFGDLLQPSVQIIDLATREVSTLVRGMTICDGIRTTAWGTVLATEEDFVTDTGSMYEILDPLSGDEYTVLDRGDDAQPAKIVDQNGGDASDRITKRTALPVIRYEGFIVDDSGAIIAGDEERPGSYGADTDGGAIYKFLPDNPLLDVNGRITRLDQSPLVSGSIYALQVSCVDDEQQFGQGCEVGNGAWIRLNPTARSGDENIVRIGREAAFAQGATAYYRVEDMHIDPIFTDPAHPNAVRFCFANTGEDNAQNWGEVQCGVDFDVTKVLLDESTGEPLTIQVVVNRFIEGDDDLNQPDNLAFQPRTGILYIIEDNPNGDVWACLPDGADRDIKSDGCIRVLRLADRSAEPTGFIFTPDGTEVYFNIQHSADSNVPLVDNFRTDDLIKLSGFNVNRVLRVQNDPNRGDFGVRVENLLEREALGYFGYGTVR